MLSPIKLRFVVPAPGLFQSGGNLYNAQLIHALKKSNADGQIISFEEFEGKKVGSDGTIYFLDTLFLDKIQHFSRELKDCFLIVHHLESLYPEADSTIVFENKERQLLKRFGGFLTSSEFTKEYLMGKGLTNKQFIVVEPALSFHPAPEKQSSDSIRALMVANLIERKGIYPFLEALRKSHIQSGKCKIHIAGSTKLEPVYAKKCLDLIASDKRLSKLVNFLGPCDLEQIQLLYRQSNLFISTSFMETFGMALQEAVAYRLPILAFDGGNTGYHIEEGKNGFLFSSIQALVDTLETLSQDKTKLKKAMEGAWDYRKSESYSWEDAAALFLKQLHQNVANRI